MQFGSLWLPGVVSAVAVFVLSSILHMVLKYHRDDYRQLAGEEAVADALRRSAPAPGVYAIPYVDNPALMKDPAVRKRFADGPIAQIHVGRPALPSMGKYLAQWFLFCLLVSFFTAYVARHKLTVGSPGLEIWRITTTVALMGYAFGYLQDSIWRLVPWASAWRGIFDAALYALTTGLVFRLLWPAA